MTELPIGGGGTSGCDLRNVPMPSLVGMLPKKTTTRKDKRDDSRTDRSARLASLLAERTSSDDDETGGIGRGIISASKPIQRVERSLSNRVSTIGTSKRKRSSAVSSDVGTVAHDESTIDITEVSAMAVPVAKKHKQATPKRRTVNKARVTKN